VPKAPQLGWATAAGRIPGGLIRKGHGLMVHTHDCLAIAKLRSERGNWVDVEWEPEIKGMFEASIRVVAKNERGVLARLASAIAETGSNIVNVSMDEDTGEATTLFFTLQVSDRIHLALILRALRRIPEVIRITRYVDSKH
jgi:guanosine-3',5'-bis(diphosphate) 3'-pyrophosphohydrolase